MSLGGQDLDLGFWALSLSGIGVPSSPGEKGPLGEGGPFEI